MKNQRNFKWGLIFIVCVTIIPFKSVNAQCKWGNRFCFHETFIIHESMIKSEGTYMAPDTMLKDVFRRYDPIVGENDWLGSGYEPRSPMILGVKLNPMLDCHRFITYVKSISKSYACYTINDSSDAILIALGITTENASEFRYRVVENDSTEIIPWSPIPRLEQNYGASRPYAFLGKYNAPGKQILVEIANTKNYGLRDGVIFDWRVNFKPIVTQIDIGSNSVRFNLSSRKLNHYATAFDSISGMPLNLKFPIDSITNLRVKFGSHPTLPYAVFLKHIVNEREIVITRMDYRVLHEDYFDLRREDIKTPGKYELLIRGEAFSLDPDYYGKENVWRLQFEVLEPTFWEKKYLAKQITLYAGSLLFLIAIAFLIYYLRNKQKLSLSIQSKEKTELQLKSIRSQLNPHFMFNALSSIQNLMDRAETSAANHYLSIFSRLTREVLNTGEKELISLEDEINLIDNYLKMEQLRFGFQYTLNIENGLNKANIEIPAMLLQPMVENAVKHGISGLRDKGVIDVSISRINQSLLLSVSDNGKGFDKSKASDDISGLGIRLTNERISLLNKIYPEQPITIEFNSSEQGTKVDIKLKDWL